MSRPRRASGPLVLLLLLLAAHAPAAAQRVQGTVTDRLTGEALPGTGVALVDGEGRTVDRVAADAQGAFVLRAEREESLRLVAERVGYQPFAEELGRVGGRISVTLPVRMAAAPVRMDPVRVEPEAPRDAVLEDAGFYARQAAGQGLFLEVGEEEAWGAPSRASEWAARLGVHFAAARRPGERDVAMPGSRCLPGIWIDGILARPGGLLPSAPPGHEETHLPTLDALVNPGEVKAIELYRSSVQVPPEFRGSSPTCGAVLVWLRHGPRKARGGTETPLAAAGP